MNCTLYRRKTSHSKWVPLVFGWADDDDAIKLRREEAALYAARDGYEWRWFANENCSVKSRWSYELGKEV